MVKFQLNLATALKFIKINKKEEEEEEEEERGSAIKTMKSLNLGLKLLAKFIAEKNTISPTSTANCIRAKKFVKIPLTKLLTLYSNFVNIMFTLI